MARRDRGACGADAPPFDTYVAINALPSLVGGLFTMEAHLTNGDDSDADSASRPKSTQDRAADVAGAKQDTRSNGAVAPQQPYSGKETPES